MTGTISSIYGARKAAGLDDDSARDVYERATGKRSLRDMTPREQLMTLNALRALSAPQDRLGGPYGKKLQALWISGWHLGAIEDRRDSAMLAFVARQTGVEATRFLRDAADARKAVEALKSWLSRRAGVEWGNDSDPADAVIRAQARLLLLDALEPTDPRPIAQAWRAYRAGELEPGQQREIMQLFGNAVRRLPKAGRPH